MQTISMQLIKEHKVLVEYAEVNAQGEKVLRPFVQPIYLRKSEVPTNVVGALPQSITITITTEQ